MQDILDELSGHGKEVFTINDMEKITKKPKKYISKQLSTNRKVISIERGKYFIDKGTGIDLYEISSGIVFPSYVSLFSAFQYYSITDQMVNTYSVISLKRHRKIIFGENILEFKTIGRERFFGYERVNNIFIASIEKAIVDSLYFNTPSFSYTKEAFSNATRRDAIDIDRLIEYSRKMNSLAVKKKVELLLNNAYPENKKLDGEPYY